MIDPTIAFAPFLEPDNMQIRFQQTLPDCIAGHWSLTDCQIQHPRYKTYVNPESRNRSFLALAYHLKGFDTRRQRPENRILYAKTFLGKRSHEEFALLSEQQPSEINHNFIHLEQFGLIGWFFPCDPVMPWLPKLLNQDYLRDYFSGLAIVSDLNEAIESVQINIVNYRPEIRCTLYYRLRTFLNISSIYGKTFADEQGAEIFERMNHFYARSMQSLTSFAIARPIRFDTDLHTLWMQGLAGKSLLDVLQERNSEALLGQLAKHLDDFHQVNYPGLSRISQADQLAEIMKKCLKLRAAFPALANRIDDLVSLLAEQLPALPKVQDHVIHGDFHIQQLMVLDDQRLALFDFDELALANPLLDVANFAADLYSLELGKAFTKALISQWFRQYQEMAAVSLTNEHFEWHLRVQLLTRAYRAYIQQKVDVDNRINDLIASAEIGYTETL